MTTTKISITSAPQTSEIPTGQSFRHTLLVDLSAFEDYPLGKEPPNQLSKAEREAAHALFTKRLEQIVKNDGVDNPPIDMVRFMPTSTREGPSDRTWKALDGLKPLHLELHCGNMEECWMSPLNELKVAWPLETLQIRGMAEEFELPWPNACRSVVSLTLDFCSSVKFTPPGGCDSLRHLSILENDALEMFTMLCVKNPLALQTLETLELKTSCRYSSSRPALFTRFLKQCASLRSLKLIFGAKESLGSSAEEDGEFDSSEDDLSEGDEAEWRGLTENSPQLSDVDSGEHADNVNVNDNGLGSNDEEEYYCLRREEGPEYGDLPLFLPNRIENLHIQGPREMVDCLTPWLDSVGNEIWLPALKTISFRLDVPADSNKVQQFLDLLSATRPTLEIID